MPQQYSIIVSGDDLYPAEASKILDNANVALKFVNHRTIEETYAGPFNRALRLETMRRYCHMTRDSFGELVFDSKASSQEGLTGEAHYRRDEKGDPISLNWMCDDSEGMGGWLEVYMSGIELKQLIAYVEEKQEIILMTEQDDIKSREENYRMWLEEKLDIKLEEE